MIYSNLFAFLAAIFALSAASAPEQPWLAPWLGLPLFAGVLFGFYRLAGRRHQAVLRLGNSAAYFAAEKRLSLLAAAFFAGSVFFFDLKYYLHPLSLRDTLPALENAGGLILFFLFLALMWAQARPGYEALFCRRYSAAGFAAANIRINLPIVLPWLSLSLLLDLISLLPAAQQLNSAWGEAITFLAAMLLLALLAPPAICRLWNCTPLEAGPQRSRIEAFCRSQHFSAKILSWPLLEGRAVTAAIMGIAPRFRYLLLTPALLSMLAEDELESVLAHEIAHAKRHHLILYVLLLLAFSLLADALSKPLLFCLLRSDWFYRLLIRLQLPADKVLTSAAAAGMFVLMLLYLRFLFGYFIRNFERQADLHVFAAQGSSFALIRAFEKIAAQSGSRRKQKNWHHFGIGERIDFLIRCERDQGGIRRHHRKMQFSLALYFAVIGLAVWPLHQLDADLPAGSARAHFVRALVAEKLRTEPKNSKLLALQGDLLLEAGMEQRALQSYAQAFSLAPMQTDLANNFAWLLLTAKDPQLRDPVKALTLARSAARLTDKGYVLDTLAVALWANGRIAEAVQAEQRAAQADPQHQAYYFAQAEKFKQISWRAAQPAPAE